MQEGPPLVLSAGVVLVSKVLSTVYVTSVSLPLLKR
jgi:hypothetical protein